MIGGKRKPHVDRCLNCGVATPGAYCSGCGQEAVDASVSFHDQLADFFAEVVSFESRLPQTMTTLIAKPGELTRAYNAGQRVRFVTPLKLYLFASVLFFLALSLAPEGGGPVVTIGLPNGHGGNIDSLDQFEVWRQTAGDAAQLPPFLEAAIRALLKSPGGFSAALMDTISKATMALVPIHAVLLMLLYRHPRRLYGEHVVFSLHVHSFGYLAFAVATVLGLVAHGKLSSFTVPAVILGTAIYLVIAAQTAYGTGLGRSLVKTLVVVTGYVVALALVIMAAAGIAFLRI